jgi:hypothetical protein
MGRPRAVALYFALSVPFGILVHLCSEFAGLGRDADDLAFSPLHAYLLLMALNDRYYVTLLNAQGNHFGPGRALNIGVRFKP